MTYAIVQLLSKPRHSVSKSGVDNYQASGYVFPGFPVKLPAIPYRFYVDAAFRDFVGYGLVNLSVANGQYDSLEITRYGHVFVPLNAEQVSQLTDLLNPIVAAIDSIRNDNGVSATVAAGSSMEVQMLQQQIAQQAVENANFQRQMLEMMRNNGAASASAPAAPAPTNHAAPVTQRPDERKNVFENAAPAVK